MEDMLHWAIANSDPTELREMANAIQPQPTATEMDEQRRRVKELSDHLAQQPTETDLMKAHIAVLSSSDSSHDDKLAAMQQLQPLLEPIDNANDLGMLGGIQPLVALLAGSAGQRLQEAAAYALGTAASNNARFQQQLLALEPDVVEELLEVSTLQDEATAAKGLYALGMLVRTLPEARAAFHAAGGLHRLQSLMGPEAPGLRVQQKALDLVTDLMEMAAALVDDGGGYTAQLGEGVADIARLHARPFAAAALHLLQQSEALDVRERALQALRGLLARGGAAGHAAVEGAGAEVVLREVLTELELMGPAIANDGWDGRVGWGDNMHEEGEGSSDQDDEMYRQYIVALCADLLHRLGKAHMEL